MPVIDPLLYDKSGTHLLVMERKVSTKSLKIGMYVSGLDRPWLDTPFLMQGFRINDNNDIESLKTLCKYIYIDVERGIEADTYLDEPAEPVSHYIDDFLKHGKREVEYQEQRPSLQEIPVAEAALDEAAIRVANIMDNIKVGDNLDVQAVKAAIQPLLDSMIRNADALLWMLSAQDNNYAYKRATDNCTLAIAFGRHLGLHKEDLRLLAMSLLLVDVGNVKISSNILNKPGRLTSAEFSVVKKHVDYGVEILRNTPGISDTVIGAVQTHHERFDGSGYPNGLKGEQIPIYGRMAAIIDNYSVMTRKTPYREAMAQHTALQVLYKWRNKYFQAELVEQFLQCLGVYPTGSLVEMTTGEVGIVVAQNKRERLKPMISMLLDEQKNPWDVSPLIDLSSNPVDESGIKRKIMRALKPGAYGTDPKISIAKWQ